MTATEEIKGATQIGVAAEIESAFARHGEMSLVQSSRRKKASDMAAMKGMVGSKSRICKSCGSYRTRVIDSRPAEVAGISSIKRRCICADCDTRWLTLEISEDDITRITRQARATDDAALVRVMSAIISSLGVSADQVISAVALAKIGGGR